jgi:chaperone required for assembly of F1-ATPase
MSGWKVKRFWKEATVTSTPEGHAITLDGRPVKTPSKTPLVVPTEALARAIAAEWDAQQGLVKPNTMPFTRTANSALDKVATQFDAVVDMLAAYGRTDLLCYRATGPARLIARQDAGWNPLLDWAAATFDAPLHQVPGVMFIDQPQDSLARLHAAVAAQSPFQIAAFHDLVAISGSLVLALAVTRNHLSPDAAFELSRIDEHWQAELWGVDEEAALLESLKKDAFHQAARFHALCRGNNGLPTGLFSGLICPPARNGEIKGNAHSEGGFS